MATLYILCGPSGSGKSTWAHNFMIETNRLGGDIRYVSRDEIRFSMLSDEDEYFAHEKEVFKRFVGYIRETLINGFDVIADATHLNEVSRARLTQAIDILFKDYEIVYVVFNVDLNTCIERNNTREGRANVPENIIHNMFNNFRAPTLDEDERAIEIIEVKD